MSIIVIMLFEVIYPMRIFKTKVNFFCHFVINSLQNE